VETWLADRWGSALERLQGPTELERQGWIRAGTLARLVREARSSRSVPRQLWYLLVLEHWLEKHQA